MRRLLPALAAAVALAAASPAAAADSLVALHPDPAAAAAVRAAGGERVSHELRLWRVPSRALAALVPRLERMHALRYAEPEQRRDALVEFRDPLSTPDISYHLYAVGADRVESPGPGFPLTIIDSGIDLGHPDFAGRPNTTALNPQRPGPPLEDSYHGTVVASTAAAASNGVGAEGVYPDAALRTYDLADLSDASVIEAIEAAVAAGPSVINLSLGGPGASRALYEATVRAVERGSLVVAASGNEFTRGNPILYPAAYPHVLTVASTDRTNSASPFSSASVAVDLAAPGEDIPVQHPTQPDFFDTESGTSFASPIVAAAAALVRTARGPMNQTQLFDLMRTSARDIDAPGFDDRTGFGLLDIPAAISRPLPPVDPQEPNDDVDQVVSGGIFGRAKQTVSRTFRARLDISEDPRDVYRVSVGPRRTVRVRVTPRGDVAAELWSAAARTVRAGTRGRVARSDRRGGTAVETVSYTNRSARTALVYLVVRPAPRSLDGTPAYGVSISSTTVRR